MISIKNKISLLNLSCVYLSPIQKERTKEGKNCESLCDSLFKQKTLSVFFVELPEPGNVTFFFFEGDEKIMSTETFYDESHN